MTWRDQANCFALKCRISIARRGLFGSARWVVQNRSHYLRKYCSPLWRVSVWFSAWIEHVRFGTDTTGVIELADLDIPSKNRHYGHYGPTRRRQFLKMLRVLRIDDYQTWTFIDLGSGKGRVLLLAAAFPFQRIIGVEFSDELNATARDNISNYRGNLRCRNIDTVCADAAEWQFPDGKMVVYLYNPFDMQIMARVLDNLESSLRAHPRDAYLVYVTPVWRDIFDRSPLLRIARSTAIWVIYRYP